MANYEVITDDSQEEELMMKSHSALRRMDIMKQFERKPSQELAKSLKDIDALYASQTATKKTKRVMVRTQEEQPLVKSMPVEAMLNVLRQQYAFGLPMHPTRDQNYIPVVGRDIVGDGGNQMAKSERASIDAFAMKRSAEVLLAKSLDNYRAKRLDAGTCGLIERNCLAAINGGMPLAKALETVNEFHAFSLR